MWQNVIAVLLTSYVILLIVSLHLLDLRVIKRHAYMFKKARKFPASVRMRGFASSDFQECGNYGSDTLVDTKLCATMGVRSDWSWSVLKNTKPPPWVSGILPLVYAEGNGSREDALMREDMKNMRAVGANCLRISISWPKLQYKGSRTELCPIELEFIKKRIALAKAHKFTLVITLLHFILPPWFSGFNEAGEREFGDFVTRIGDSLPDFSVGGVEYFVSINEPNIHTLHGYVIGTRPPGIQNVVKAMHAYQSMMRFHVIARDKLRIMRNSNHRSVVVTPACNLILFEPKSKFNIVENLLCVLVDTLFNRSILDVVLMRDNEGSGLVDEQQHKYKHKRPRARIKRDPPCIGLNQYTRVTVVCDLLELNFDHECRGDVKTIENDLNWDISPLWFHSVLQSVTEYARRNHVCDAKIFITEHGIPDESDYSRQEFLKYTADVLMQHTNVIGYCMWSFTDNIEWELSIGSKFGVCEVEYANGFRRRKRRSYYLLKKLWATCSTQPQPQPPSRKLVAR